jgi:DNA polymerase elongation subunit (family B)
MLDDCLELKEAIEKETGFALSFEGIHKWIAFVHSKQNDTQPVPNRYFGLYEDGTLKIRGIEARRHDTPVFFCKFQQEALEILSEGNNIKEVKSLLPKVVDIFHKYVQLLKENKVPIDELAFTKRLSKDSNNYQNRNTIESNALTKLNNERKFLKAGETLQYIITDYYQTRFKNNRAIPIELIDERTCYDVKRYIELLTEACNSVTEPFGLKLQLPLIAVSSLQSCPSIYHILSALVVFWSLYKRHSQN